MYADNPNFPYMDNFVVYYKVAGQSESKYFI